MHNSARMNFGIFYGNIKLCKNLKQTVFTFTVRLNLSILYEKIVQRKADSFIKFPTDTGKISPKKRMNYC